jgi:hypothetical protein
MNAVKLPEGPPRAPAERASDGSRFAVSSLPKVELGLWIAKKENCPPPVCGRPLGEGVQAPPGQARNQVVVAWPNEIGIQQRKTGPRRARESARHLAKNRVAKNRAVDPASTTGKGAFQG